MSKSGWDPMYLSYEHLRSVLDHQRQPPAAYSGPLSDPPPAPDVWSRSVQKSRMTLASCRAQDMQSLECHTDASVNARSTRPPGVVRSCSGGVAGRIVGFYWQVRARPRGVMLAAWGRAMDLETEGRRSPGPGAAHLPSMWPRCPRRRFGQGIFGAFRTSPPAA